MDIQTIAILSLSFAAFVAIVVLVYAFFRARKLKKMAYEIFYYFSSNCNSLLYYRDETLHINRICEDKYGSLVKNKDRWFLFINSKDLLANTIHMYELSSNWTEDISPFLSLNHYFTKSESDNFPPLCKELEELMATLYSIPFKIFLMKEHGKDAQISKTIELDNLRKEHNKEFVGKELKDNKKYFDSLLKYPLDPQQRESIVKLEDNCLVISAAGSGKTSTSIAKVKYLLDKRKLKPKQILVLSYNRKTAEEFKKRLDVPEVTCETFHKTAMDIISEVEGIKPVPCDNTFIFTCFYSLLNKSLSFKKNITTFFSEETSIVHCIHEYKSAKQYFRERARYGIIAPYKDLRGKYIYTKSEEERRICTWLSTHGVKFLYEEPYPGQVPDPNHKTYKPDFTIFYAVNGENKKAYLEHFGINAEGNVPEWFGDGVEGGYHRANTRYKDGINWKKRLHQDRHTCLISTTSAMFHDGTIFDILKSQLQNLGIPCIEWSTEEKYTNLIRRNKAMEDSIKNLISSFINLMKSNGRSFDDIYRRIVESNEDESSRQRSQYLMYEIIKPLKEEYERELKNKGQMDFTDIILKATDLCNSKKYIATYDYVIVDEFQDISVDRYKFLLSLRKDSPLTKMYCVGDDWQSIYRFAGSDMNLFSHFEKYFGFTERCKIETTYRFGNPLIGKSSDFILKNPTQQKKEVKPYSNNVSTELSFISYDGNSHGSDLQHIEEILKDIPTNESVLLLARYNYETDVFPDNCVKTHSDGKKAKVTFANHTMEFMSIHAAKGLEADHVLILNCSQDGSGFPSRISDDPILNFVLSEIDDFEFSEERRLFYVAITRAKKHTYVLYNANMPSVFVNEFINDDSNDLMTCPVCKKGFLKKYHNIAGNGRPYYSYYCNNKVAGCRYGCKVFFEIEDDEKVKFQKIWNKFIGIWNLKLFKDHLFNLELPDNINPNNYFTSHLVYTYIFNKFGDNRELYIYEIPFFLGYSKDSFRVQIQRKGFGRASYHENKISTTGKINSEIVCVSAYFDTKENVYLVMVDYDMTEPFLNI